jgi:multicomponent Na+:H+ antiporter subunit G
MLELLQTVASALLLLVGTLLLVLAGVGVIRMPDLFLRMSTSSKASSLGAASVLLGVAIAVGEVSVLVRAVAGVLFLVLTAPVAAHMIGRAAYELRVPLWRGMVVDELEGRYDTARHTLASGPEAERR